MSDFFFARTGIEAFFHRKFSLQSITFVLSVQLSVTTEMFVPSSHVTDCRNYALFPFETLG